MQVKASTFVNHPQNPYFVCIYTIGPLSTFSILLTFSFQLQQDSKVVTKIAFWDWFWDWTTARYVYIILKTKPSSPLHTVL